MGLQFKDYLVDGSEYLLLISLRHNHLWLVRVFLLFVQFFDVNSVEGDRHSLGPVGHLSAELEERKDQRGNRKLLPFVSSFHEHSFEFHEEFEVDVLVSGVREQVHQLGNSVLTLFKFVGFFFILRGFAHQERHDEVNQLLASLGATNLLAFLYHGLHDLQSHLSPVLKFHILHQLRIVVHGEDLDREALERNREQLDEELHGGLILVGDGGRFED